VTQTERGTVSLVGGGTTILTIYN